MIVFILHLHYHVALESANDIARRIPKFMRLPLIVQFRRKLIARRQSALFDRHPGLILFVAFAGPLLGMLGFSTYRLMQQYTTKGLPVVPLLLAAFEAWIGVGLSRQLRLNRDRKWNNFIRYMPIRPSHLLALHVYMGLPAGIIGIVLLISGLCGAGVNLWTISAAIKWLTIGVALILALSLQSFLAIVASRFSRGQRLLLFSLMLWGILFLARFAWSLKSGNPYPSCLTDTCLSDPVLVASGMVSLVSTLIPQQITFQLTGLRAVLHLAVISTILTLLSWKLVRQPPLSLPARPKDLFLTIPLRKLISHILPDARGGQTGIELLRTLRGPRLRLLFYLIVSVIAGVGLQIAHPDDNYHILILTVFAMLAVNERADLLKIRRADFLYYLYGVDAKDYLLGLTTSVGLLISVLCMIQVPILRIDDTHTTISIICACIALAFSSTGMNVAFDHYSRHTRFFKYFITALLFFTVISKAWSMIPFVIVLSFNVIRLPSLIYSLILFSISLGVNGFVPLLIAGVIVTFEIVRANPDVVKKWYWRISE